MAQLQTVAGCAAAFAVSAALAQADPPAPDTPSVDGGKRLYKSYCARCHGLNMVTSSAAVFDLRTFPKDDKRRFVDSVMKGKRAMPAWDGTLKQADIDQLWAYVSAAR